MNLFAQVDAIANSRGPWRWLLLAAITLFMLWAGLDPKGYRFHNEVEWIDGTNGVRIGRFGRLQTEPFLSGEQAAALNRSGYAMELALDPSSDPHGAFGVIACLHNGDDAAQLVIGQWRNYLIVMNGRDYSHRHGLPRVSADISKYPKGPLRLSVNSSRNGTSLSLNGKAATTNAQWQLTLPVATEPGRFVMGNSVSASRSWRGVISYFSLAPHSMASSEIKSRPQASGEPSPSTEEPLVLYRFNESAGSTIQNHGSLPVPLEIPAGLNAIGRRFLRGSMADPVPNSALMLDSVVNFIGFMPFGAAFVLVLQPSGRSRRSILLLTALAGFALSLLIELTQAWMPTRDSSLRDLLLNTAGAPLGAWLWQMARQLSVDSLARYKAERELLDGK